MVKVGKMDATSVKDLFGVPTPGLVYRGMGRKELDVSTQMFSPIGAEHGKPQGFHPQTHVKTHPSLDQTWSWDPK